MQIGNIIRKIRKERDMTLVELAEKSGVALATMSRIENDRMTGTLDSHMRICEALGVTLPDMYKNLYPSKTSVDIQRQKSRTDVFIHDKKSSEEMLALKVLNKKMMPVLIKIAKGGCTQKEETKPGIEKFAYVLEGRIEANIGEEKYALARNDSVYFESNVPHYFKNSGASDARVISVVCPPTI